jgi:hypothetical protein
MIEAANVAYDKVVSAAEQAANDLLGLQNKT